MNPLPRANAVGSVGDLGLAETASELGRTCAVQLLASGASLRSLVAAAVLTISRDCAAWVGHEG